MIAEDCYEKLWLLSNCFLSPDKEDKIIASYLSHGRVQEWDSIVTALNQIPLHEVPPEHVETLAVMRNATGQAVFVCGLLKEWMLESSHPEIVELLRARRDLLALKKALLPWPEGVPDRVDRRNQDSGLGFEKNFPIPNPIVMDGAKVYSRYFYDGSSCPEWVWVQIVFPYGDSPPFNFQLEKELPPGWISMDGAKLAVREKASEIIGDIHSDSY